MKRIKGVISLSVIFIWLACDQSNEMNPYPASIPSCLHHVLDSIRCSTFNFQLYELDTRQGKMYHLKNSSLADEKEWVYDVNCNAICYVDCICIPPAKFCEPWVFEGGVTLIWKSK
ncbi:MAG TPA: hypothetical protein PKD32_04000 [Saprospiraceae bacterium]|nr:hypothetical protein [Saprospiraceae bacterium]